MLPYAAGDRQSVWRDGSRFGICRVGLVWRGR
jgi:hypothetical protein